ncbi:hypothetical protein ACKWTF_013502 [Chironomus riparius]
MHEILNRIRRNFQNIQNCFKLKFAKNQTSPPRYILFEDFLTYETTINLLGFTFVERNRDKLNKWLKWNGFCFQLLIFLFLILELVSFILSLYNNNVPFMLENALLIGVFFVVLFKGIIIFHVNAKKILEIIKKLDEYFPHSGVDQLSFKVHTYLRINRWLENSYYFRLTFIVLHLTLMPCLHQLYGILYSVEVEWELMFNLDLSVDLLQPFVYELVSIIEVLLMIASSIYIICTDLLFVDLVHVLVMEFDILCIKIIEIGLIKDEQEAIRELKNLINVHQKLIEISQKLNKVFSPLQLINAFGTIVALCFGCFLVVSGISPYFIVKFYVFPVLVPLQIFALCYFPQLLINSSTAICTSAYNIEWYSRSVKFQHYLLLIMLRAQKPQTIKAWKFFDMSLEIFQWIMTTSYSYYSVLKSTYGL